MERKIIIYNIADDVPDEVGVEMVLRVIKEGRANRDVSYNPHTKFNGCYHVDCKKSIGKWGTDIFWISKGEKKDAR